MVTIKNYKIILYLYFLITCLYACNVIKIEKEFNSNSDTRFVKIIDPFETEINCGDSLNTVSNAMVIYDSTIVNPLKGIIFTTFTFDTIRNMTDPLHILKFETTWIRIFDSNTNQIIINQKIDNVNQDNKNKIDFYNRQLCAIISTYCCWIEKHNNLTSQRYNLGFQFEIKKKLE